MIQPMVSSMIADDTITCPRSRRGNFMSRTIAATILIEEIDNAGPRESAGSSRRSALGSSESGSSQPRATPRQQRTPTPAIDTPTAALPTLRTSLRSVSMPVSSSRSRMPNCEIASSMLFCSFDAGKIACCTSGSSAPSTEGPSRTPASSWPITAGWPMRTIASPSSRPVSISTPSWATNSDSDDAPPPPRSWASAWPTHISTSAPAHGAARRAECKPDEMKLLIMNAAPTIIRSGSLGSIAGTGAESAFPAKRFEGRQLLTNVADLLPRILVEPAQALHQVEHRVVIAGSGAGGPLPRHRHRDRRAGTRARRIGGHRGLLQRVAEIVDKDFPPTRRLGHLGEVAVRLVGRHRLRERLHEG